MDTTMDTAMIRGIAAQLAAAEESRQPLPPLSQTYPGLTPEQAYAIQSSWFEMKIARGATLIGRKIGLTSKAMQDLLGVDQPDYGFLLDTMVISPGSTVPRSDFLAPRLEPEIAFWLARDLRGPGVTIDDVLAATEGVSPSLELVDSRIANWQITLVDTIADNGSSARVIVPEQMLPLTALDLVAEQVTLLRNGEVVGSGTGAAVLGHPAAAVAWLANMLAAFGTGLRAGQLVLPGAMCAAASANAGDTFSARFSTLGEIAIRFV